MTSSNAASELRRQAREKRDKAAREGDPIRKNRLIHEARALEQRAQRAERT